MSHPNKSELIAYLATNPTASVQDVYMDFPYNGKNPTRRRQRIERMLDRLEIDAVHNPEDTTQPIIAGVLEASEDSRVWAKGSTFVFTSAQANTLLNDKFWRNLMRLVTDKDAELHVSRFTYNKASTNKRSVKPGSDKPTDDDDIWFDPRIVPYLSDESLQITSDLIWCGELNIIPTRADPINGFENYGRGSSVIVPHTKMAMRSIPTMKNASARFAYSTGTVTARNYLEKAAGQKASLHHVYGALLVEVDESGTWWARQINADPNGTIYDLNTKYEILDNGEEVKDTNVRSLVVTYGDLHGNKIDTDIVHAMADVNARLNPMNHVFHDTVDFQPRNHHNINDPHFMHQMQVDGKESVEGEFSYIGEIMSLHFAGADAEHYIVTSNHDQAVEGWLRNIKGFFDPVNMRTWLQMNDYCAEEREAGRKPRPFWKMLQRNLDQVFSWRVIHEDDSLQIGGIEHGLHGHLGPNGARGSPKNLRTAGKANTGHTHSAGIVEGVYTAGVFGKLDMGYNKGLSGWSHSFIVTYPNGKRTICTFRGTKAWR